MKTDAVWFVLTPAAAMSRWLLPGCEIHLRQLCFHPAVVTIDSATQQHPHVTPADINWMYTEYRIKNTIGYWTMISTVVLQGQTFTFNSQVAQLVEHLPHVLRL